MSGNALACWAIGVLLLATCIEHARGPALYPDSPGQQVKQTLSTLWQDVEPHPVGSRAHSKLRASIIEVLTARGLNPTLQRSTQCTADNRCARLTNIIVHIPGQRKDALLLSAHYDSVPASPGAGDDGAGVAALIEAATKWAREPATNSLILLINDGEELGLLGATAFMTEHPLASNVEAVINLEARGSSGPAWMFEMGPNSTHLLEAFAASTSKAYTSSLAATVYGWLSNATDVDVYKAHDLPALNFAFLAGGANYHTANDSLDNLADRSIQSHSENIWHLVDSLREAKLKASPKAPVVFFDLLGWLIILPITGMWGLGFGLIAASALLIHRLRPDKWGWALASWSGFLVTTAVAGLVTVEMLNFSSQNLNGWVNAPRASVLALFIALIAWSMEWTGLNQHRSRSAALIAIVISYTSLSLLSLVVLPAASYLFIFPAMAAVLAVAVQRYHDGWYPQALLLIHLTAVLLWAPVVSGLYAALGLNAAPLLALCFAICFGPMAPLLPAPSKHSRALALIPAAVALTLILVSVPSKHNNPRPLNLVYVNNQGAGEARLYMVSTPEPLPHQATALRNLRDRSPLTPWTRTPLPSSPFTSPQPETYASKLNIHTDPSTGISTVTGPMASQSNTAVLGLAFHRKSGVSQISLDGSSMTLGYADNWALVQLHGFHDQPQLHFTGSLEEGAAYIFDTRYSLPEAARATQVERDRFGMPFSQGDRSITIQPLLASQGE